jgi:hypothetical protein
MRRNKQSTTRTPLRAGPSVSTWDRDSTTGEMLMPMFRGRRSVVYAALGTVWVCVALGCGSDGQSAAAPLSAPPASTGATGNTLQPSGTAGGRSNPIAPAPPATAAIGGIQHGVGGSPAMDAAAGAGSSEAGAPVLPCSVSKLLVTNCQTCHGATPIGGAPMSLVTYADLHKPAATAPSMQVYQLAKLRMNDKMKPMPPGSMIAPADFTALDTWLGGGAMPGTAADATCDAGKPPTGADQANSDGTTGPLVPEPGETCYEFKNHQSTASVDDAPYDIGGPGEHYEQFYFTAPWPTGTVCTRFGGRYDNLKILHHWLLFSTNEKEVEGFHKTAPLPTLIGVNAQLLTGWAVGGTNLAMPKDVGFELPAQGAQLNAQWHFYNSTTTDQKDRSSIQICTVPAGARPHTAAVTWTGTEDLGGNKWFGGKGMPPHAKSTFQGTCNPLRTGMNATEPIHIIGFWPHMHRLGTNMKAVINHKDGSKETIFDKPFDFNNQVHFVQYYDLMPGDTMTTVCDFDNTTDKGVPFGESSDTEMCYMFTTSWPAHAFENHVASLIGATNTCW